VKGTSIPNSIKFNTNLSLGERNSSSSSKVEIIAKMLNFGGVI
jgi:hypothetical protein